MQRALSSLPAEDAAALASSSSGAVLQDFLAKPSEFGGLSTLSLGAEVTAGPSASGQQIFGALRLCVGGGSGSDVRPPLGRWVRGRRSGRRSVPARDSLGRGRRPGGGWAPLASPLGQCSGVARGLLGRNSLSGPDGLRGWGMP